MYNPIYNRLELIDGHTVQHSKGVQSNCAITERFKTWGFVQKDIYGQQLVPPTKKESKYQRCVNTYLLSFWKLTKYQKIQLQLRPGTWYLNVSEFKILNTKHILEYVVP